MQNISNITPILMPLSNNHMKGTSITQKLTIVVDNNP